MENKKLSRPELIYALARHAHPNSYHGLLSWKTEYLRKLLSWYEGLRDNPLSAIVINCTIIISPYVRSQ